MSNALDLARTQYDPKTGKTYQRRRVGAILFKDTHRLHSLASWQDWNEIAVEDRKDLFFAQIWTLREVTPK